MSLELIAQKYSQALFDIAETGNKTAQIGFELEQLSKVFSQQEVKAFFASPFNTNENKLTVAKASLEGKCSPETFNFMITLTQNERLMFVSEISSAYQTLVRAKTGETEGVLYVATDVSPQFKADVEVKLSKSLNKKVKLTIKKDSSLLSGYKVTVGGWTMDDSAQIHLNKIRSEISKRGI